MSYDGTGYLLDNRSTTTPWVCFGQVIYNPGGACGPRIQKDFQLVWIHSGEGRVQVEQEVRSLELGMIHFFKPGHREQFTFSTTHPTHHSWCTVAPERMPEAFARSLAVAPVVAPASETFERIFAAAMMIARPASPGANLVVEQLAVSLFAEFLRLTEGEKKSAKYSMPMHKALAYIDHHFGEQDCMINAIKASGVSAGALAKQFKHAVGTPPARYLWQCRTERALGMLINTGLSIAEIAMHCGFQSQFHLSRLVKQRQGVSPREFRKQNWAGRQVAAIGKAKRKDGIS